MTVSTVLKVGDEIEVSYRLAGRRWQKDPQSEVKFFLNAEATGFKSVSAKSGGAADANAAFAEASYEDDDDVPF